MVDIRGFARPASIHRAPIRGPAISIVLLALVSAGATLALPAPEKGSGGRRLGSMVQGGGSALRVKLEALPVTFVQLAALDRDAVETRCNIPDNGVLPDDLRLLADFSCQPLPDSAGLDHVAAGAGVRNTGFGTVRLRGAPRGAVAFAAWLYVGLIEHTPDLEPVREIAFEGHRVTAQRVARMDSLQHCWTENLASPTTSVVTFYRVSVLPLLPAVIDGDYSVSGIPSALDDGRDPQREERDPSGNPIPLKPPLAQGITLTVVYAHEEVPHDSVVYVHETPSDAPMLANRDLAIGHPLSPPLPDWTYLRLTTIGGDGQIRAPYPLGPTATELWAGSRDVGASAFDTHPAEPVRIRGAGSGLEPDLDWPGADGGSMTQLWDTRTSDVERARLGNALPAASDRYELVYRVLGGSVPEVGYDCVNVLAHVLGVRVP